MTPIWVLILVGVIAALSGAAVGAVITQIGAAQAATRAWRREEQRRVEERAHEDHRRTFVERQRAYLSLFQALQMVKYSARVSFESELPETDVNLTAQFGRLLETITPVEIFGSQEVAALSWKVVNHAAFLMSRSGPLTARAEDFRNLQEDAKVLVARMRADLHVDGPN